MFPGNWEVEGALGRSGATVEELLEAAKPIMVKMPVKGQAFSDIVQKMSSVACLSLVIFLVCMSHTLVISYLSRLALADKPHI